MAAKIQKATGSVMKVLEKVDNFLLECGYKIL